MLLNIIHLKHRNDRRILLDKELEEQNISEYKIWDGIIDPLIAARGISQAHKQIVYHAKEQRLSEVLICEDDVHFTAVGAFDFFIKNKPDDFDIYLGSISDGIIKKDNSVDDFTGTTIYIIKEAFYEIFLSLSENLNIDRALTNRGKFIVCNPFIAIQHNGFSDNTKRYYDHQEYLNGRRLFGIN